MTMLSSKTLPKLIQAIGYEAVSSDSELFEAALVLLEHDLSHNRPLLLQHLCGVVRALKKKQWSASNDLILAAMLMTLLMTEDVIAAELIDQFGNRRVTLAETACALLMPLVSEMEQHSGKTTQPTEVAHSAHLASFYRATYLDFEVALLCLADHYARKEDLAGLDYVRQRKWAEITDLIYVPLCELLGMWDVRRELADASIAWLLGRKERQALEEAIEEYKGHNETSFRVLQTQVKTAFVRNKLSADILIHESTPGSLYQRQRKARRTDRYFDLKAELSTLRVDVIIHTGNEQGSSEEGLMIEQLECYRALGSLHSLGQPANTKSGEASRLRDLIVKPAANGYSCLITTITWFDPDRRDGEAHRRLVEFRLRTDRMEKINALGIVAAHRLRAPVHVPPNVWWNNAETRELIAGRPNTVSNQQNDTLYVFRPNGEIYTFPRGSTVLDYAFRVHSDLGVYARAFTMNGRRVEKGALLSNGALVEVEFDRSSPGVEEDWLACARTAKALHHIRHTLQQRAKTEKIERFLVDRVVKRELKAHALQLSVQEIEAAIHSVARQLGFSDIRQLYWVVERGELAADEIAMSIIEAQYVSHIAGPNGDPWPKRRIRIARCCLDSSFWLLKKKTGSFIGPHVAPGEPLVGKIVGNAEPPHQTHLVVHHQACPKAPKGSEPLTWHEHAGTRQTVQVTILAWDRPYLLGSILACIYASYGVGNGLNLTKLDAQVLDDASVLVEFVVDAPQEDHLEKLRDALEKLKGSGVIHNFEFWRSLSSAYSSVLSSGRMNPYTLLPIKNPAMLFGRDDDMMTLRRKIGGGERFLTVHGQSGVGKTSLLEQLKRVIEETESEIIPVVFDVQGWESKTIALLAAMEHKVIKELRAQAGPHENTPQLPRIHEKELSRDPFGAFRDWLVRITERLGGRHLLLVI
ncbi:MAG TPA: TGS domain-containing protein, partial [Ktedonobacterales bacterium]|nr:TGS domain-containing protein [Ktedonobacterales bacterium]